MREKVNRPYFDGCRGVNTKRIINIFMNNYFPPLHNNLLALCPNQIRSFYNGFCLRVCDISHVFRVQSNNEVSDLNRNH